VVEALLSSLSWDASFGGGTATLCLRFLAELIDVVILHDYGILHFRYADLNTTVRHSISKTYGRVQDDDIDHQTANDTTTALKDENRESDS
jgi:hypothetical protein